jgi:uncharacterized membrane protein YdjX (TVP38/TMEM64 family)
MGKLKPLAPGLLIVLGLLLGYAFGVQDYLSLTYLAAQRGELQALVASHHAAAAALFLGIYVVAVALSFPAASVLTVFGGFLFGWALGGALVAVGATVGATVLFLAARSAAGGFLRERAAGTAAKLAEGFERNAFSYLLVIRLAPVFPFFAVNIAAALFRIGVRDYVAATFLGILPGTFAYAWLGEGVDSVLAAAQATGHDATIGDLVTPEITLAFVALAVAAAIPTVVAQVRRRRGS